MKALPLFAGTFALGGFACWLPSIALHLMRGNDFSSPEVLALSGAMPAVAFAALNIARRLPWPSRGPVFAPVAVGLGMWILGPLAMCISATPSGGGFATPDGWLALPVLTALFPLTTVMISTYDGSLGGLVLGSTALLVVFFRAVVGPRPQPQGSER